MIIDNKERIQCSGELGTISIDGIEEYKLGDTFEVKLAEIRSTTRQLIAKPIKTYPELKTTAQDNENQVEQ